MVGFSIPVDTFSHSEAVYGDAPTALLEPLVSIAEAAELLGVSTRTILRLADAGDLQRVRIGRRTLFEPRVIRGYRDRQRERGSP